MQQAEMGRHAGVGKNMHLSAPAEFPLQELDAEARRAVVEMPRILAAEVGIKAADAEVAARDHHRAACRAPVAGRDVFRQGVQGGQPAGRERFFHRTEERKRHAVATTGSEHGGQLQGPAALQQGGERRRGVAKRSETTGRFNPNWKLVRGRAHAAQYQAAVPDWRARMKAARPATLDRAVRDSSLLLILMPNSFSSRTTSSSASTESSPKREEPNRGSSSGMSSGRTSSRRRLS